MIKDKQKPLVSIITATFNSEKTIKDAIESLLNQTYPNIEYIIIDGKSSDNTISIIDFYVAKFIEKNIIFKFLSEKDNGIADAWNKGIKLATGEIIGMLNSDDWFEANSITYAVELLNTQKPELSYGICKKVNSKKEVTQVINRNFNPKKIYLNFGFSHTTCFVTKKAYDEVGVFNTNYKIAIDTDFLLRFFKQGFVFKKCKNITYMRLGGVSTKFKKTALVEYEKALKDNGFNLALILFFGLIKRGIFIIQKLK